jgi:hypothetical protein
MPVEAAIVVFILFRGTQTLARYVMTYFGFGILLSKDWAGALRAKKTQCGALVTYD